MAKDKEKSESTEQKIERYEITELVQRDGYPGGLIDGKFIVIIPAKFDKIPFGSSTRIGIVQPAQCFIGDDPKHPELHKKTDGEYFENLSFEQVHQLLIAGVIKLNKQQQEDYKKQVATLYKKKE